MGNFVRINNNRHLRSVILWVGSGLRCVQGRKQLPSRDGRVAVVRWHDEGRRGGNRTKKIGLMCQHFDNDDCFEIEGRTGITGMLGGGNSWKLNLDGGGHFAKIRENSGNLRQIKSRKYRN